MTDREIMKLALEALKIADKKIIAGGIESDARLQMKNAIAALRQALEQPDPFSRLVRIMGTFDLSTGHADNWNDLLNSLESELRDVLGYYRETFKVEQECSTHPDAPHGFNRDASHNYGRYVCDCEGWEPPDDDAAWARYLKEPMSEKSVHESDTMERHVSYVCPQCHWTLEQQYDQTALELCDVCGWKTLIPDDGCLNCERAKVEQEPVAWLDVDEDEAYSNSEIDEEAKKDLTPLYLAPPSPEKDLIVGYAETNDLARDGQDFWVNRQPGKNTVPLYANPININPLTAEAWCNGYEAATKQFKRNWVGLTDEERYLNDCRSEEEIEYARAIEAKLKEKNL